MMIVLYLVVGFVSLLAQGVLLHSGVAEYLVPQLVVLLVVFLAFYEVSITGSFLAFFLGLLLDISSAQALGPWAGACVALYGVLALLSQRLFIDSGVVAAVISFVAVVVAQGLFLTIGVHAPDLSWGLAGVVLSRAFVSAVMSPLLFSFLFQRARKISPPVVGRATMLSSV